MPNGTLIAGRYEILAEIGRGGMGMVARAYDHRLDTEVAIKVLRPDLAKDSGDKDSLIKEARVLARLSHPSIVRLFDLAETEVGLLLVLEYVKGPNLSQVLRRRKRLNLDELLHVMHQICDGLASAHAVGVIHRDLKPPNILVAATLTDLTSPEFLLRSTVKITDFGISKLLASKLETAALPLSDEPATTIAGTPIFMAPEQFAGRPSSPATDIYALGVITYIALSGAPPFISDDMEQLAAQHLHATAKPIANCSGEVNAVIQRALAKTPESRFQSALDFFTALQIACQPPSALPAPPILEPDSLDRAAAWFYRNRWRLSVAAIGLFVLAIRLLIWFHAANPAPTSTARFQQAVPPSLGKLIHLPTDLDIAPASLTVPAPAPALPSRPGPHKPPHALWTAWTEEPNPTETIEMDGASPEGTAYIRDDASQSLWAVKESGLQWGFRTPEPGNPDHGALLNPTWPNRSYKQLPIPLRLEKPQNLAVSSDFREVDAQNGEWPEEKPQLRYHARLGSVTLSSLDQHWSLALDSLPKQSLQTSSNILVVTANQLIYFIDSTGHVKWTYQSPDQVSKMEALPSGDMLLIAGPHDETLRDIHIGVKAWEFKARSWIAHFGPVDSTGAIYFVTWSESLAFYALAADGKLMWSWLWDSPLSSKETLLLDNAGRLYLSGGRFAIQGADRRAIVCLSE